jgi:nitrate/TMAO reductase-like tetraheme cytochrome c subunit
MTLSKSDITIHQLRQKGIHITPGREYIPKEWLPKKVLSLAQVRRRLAKIKGNLSDTIAEIRKEE